MHLTSRRLVAAVAIASTAALWFSAAATADHLDGEVWTGSPRADQYMGTRHDDTARGLGGPDAMQGHRGMDDLDGGAGWDTVSGGPRSDIIWGGTGRDVTTGGDAGDLVLEDDGDDLVNGGTGSDWLLIGRGSDVMQAGAGRDLIFVYQDGDPDTLQCGAGRDLVAHVDGAGALDRFRGCESRYDLEELEKLVASGAVELPPFPPILDRVIGHGAGEEAARSELTSGEALRWSVRQLRASAN